MTDKTDDARGLLREAVKVIDSLDATIAGEISNDWADFFGKDWEDMYNIKSRITAHLAAPAPEPVAKFEHAAYRAAREELKEYRQQDDYLLAHGASLLSDESHEIFHVDALRRVVRAVLASLPLPKEQK